MVLVGIVVYLENAGRFEQVEMVEDWLGQYGYLLVMPILLAAGLGLIRGRAKRKKQEGTLEKA